MNIIQPQETSNIEDRLTTLEQHFQLHSHADGWTQPVWIGKSNQGTSNIIIPTTSGVLGEAVSNGSSLYIKNDGKIWKADATTQAIADAFVGISDRNGIAGETASYICYGSKVDYSGLTPGAIFYLSDTAGVLSTSAGTIAKKVAVALSSTILFIKNI